MARKPEVVSARLLRRLSAGDILLLHDGDAARSDSGQPILLEVLPTVLAAFSAAGLKAITLTTALQNAESVLSGASQPPGVQSS